MKLKLTERHRNGAFFEIKGKPEEVVPFLLEWRIYQDGNTPTRNVVGFIKSEEKN